MITLQKENVQKIVTSKEQAAKLILLGFRVVDATDEEVKEEVPMSPVPTSPPVLLSAPGFTCQICGKTYKTEDGLEQHMASKHPTVNEGGESIEPTGTDTDIVKDRVKA